MDRLPGLQSFLLGNLNELKILRKKKLIEGRAPNVYIAFHLAEIMGEKAQYIKNRGLDDLHYKKMLLELIERFGHVKREDVDTLLFNKLPDVFTLLQKKNKIGNLLTKLRKSGLIINTGSRTASRWELIKKG